MTIKYIHVHTSAITLNNPFNNLVSNIFREKN